MHSLIQCMTKVMNTVYALLCFVVVRSWPIWMKSSCLLIRWQQRKILKNSVHLYFMGQIVYASGMMITNMSVRISIQSSWRQTLIINILVPCKAASQSFLSDTLSRLLVSLNRLAITNLPIHQFTMITVKVISLGLLLLQLSWWIGELGRQHTCA